APPVSSFAVPEPPGSSVCRLSSVTCDASPATARFRAVLVAAILPSSRQETFERIIPRNEEGPGGTRAGAGKTSALNACSTARAKYRGQESNLQSPHPKCGRSTDGVPRLKDPGFPGPLQLLYHPPRIPT